MVVIFIFAIKRIKEFKQKMLIKQNDILCDIPTNYDNKKYIPQQDINIAEKVACF